MPTEWPSAATVSLRSLVLTAPSPLTSASSSVPDCAFGVVDGVGVRAGGGIRPAHRAVAGGRSPATGRTAPRRPDRLLGLPVGSIPSAYQPSPKLLVGLPVPDTPVSVSRLVMPLAPKLIERSLPVRLTVAVVPVLKRLTLPLGVLLAVEVLAVPQEFHVRAGTAAGQPARQGLQRRARRDGLVEIDVEILDEGALGDALLDHEILDRERGGVGDVAERHVGRGRPRLRSVLHLLLVVDADAEEAVGVRLAVAQGVVGHRAGVDAAAIRRARH